MKKALIVTGILAGVILTAVTVTNIIKNRQAVKHGAETTQQLSNICRTTNSVDCD